MTTIRGRPSLNVLLSAYACTPDTGSEPGVGFETLRAVSQQHNVWVLTRRKNVEPLEQYFTTHPPVGTIRIIGIDLSASAVNFKKRFGSLGTQWYYDRWQQLAKRCLAKLFEDNSFDLVHHITFASDWGRAGVATNNVPFVWGPIGGGVRVPPGLLSSMGRAGLLNELFRIVGRGLMRRRTWYGEAWRSASVVLVQNQETRSLATQDVKALVLPNGTAIPTVPPRIQGKRNKEIIVVGRLIPWKGGYLALRVLSQLRHEEFSLHFLGSGPEKRRLQKIAARLELAGRVHFEGSLQREAVLERTAQAGALLHTALHEESSVAVGEALSLGTPVVCLDHGGPRELLRRWPESPSAAVRVTDIEETSQRLAEALDGFLDKNFPIQDESLRSSPSFATSILEAYDLAVRSPETSEENPSQL